MRITLSVDDGCASDVRVADLAKQYDIQTVFYWPVEWYSLAFEKGYVPLSIDEALEISDEFEIGSHTCTHRHLTSIPVEDAKWEIWESQKRLEELFNQPIRKFCPPRGYTNKELTEFTLQHYDSQRLTKGLGLVHVHPDSGANNNKPWQEAFKAMKKRTDEIELWGHSHEFDRFDMWDEIETFLNEQL